MKRRIIISMVFGAITILSHQNLYAFENVKTHPALTAKAAAASTMDDYLGTYLWLYDDEWNYGINAQLSYNFSSEIRTRINRAHWNGGKTKRTALEWLKVGSATNLNSGDNI